MPASRRPDPGRAARSAARAAARRAAAARTGSAGERAAQQRRAQRRGAGLTTRAALLGLVLCGLVVSAALPLREYLSQRAEIGRLEQQQALQRERVEALEAAKRQLEDPAFVTAEARRRLHFVKPGETAYVLLTPRPGEAPLGATAESVDEPAGPEGPWYSQLWSSVEVADRAQPAPSGPAPSGPAAPGPAAPAPAPPPAR
jgi:cell division protein FtsB